MEFRLTDCSTKGHETIVRQSCDPADLSANQKRQKLKCHPQDAHCSEMIRSVYVRVCLSVVRLFRGVVHSQIRCTDFKSTNKVLVFFRNFLEFFWFFFWIFFGFFQNFIRFFLDFFGFFAIFFWGCTKIILSEQPLGFFSFVRFTCLSMLVCISCSLVADTRLACLPL